MSQQNRTGRPLRRGTGPSSARRDSLLIFTEGESTEVSYINFWYRRHRDRIIVEIADNHGTPMTLVEAAVKRRADERRAEARGRGKAHTEYWCVFDRDEHPLFSAAVSLATREKINLAVSNPCLELWFVWHFEDQTRHIERSALQSKSRRILKCNKTLTQEALALLADESRYEAARQRAAKLDAKHAGDGSPPGSNPSSSVHKLIDRIRRGTEN